MLSFVCSVAREKNPKITRMYMIYAITDIALTMIVMYLVINDVWLSFVAVDIDCLVPLSPEIMEIEGRWCLCVVLCEGLIYLPLNIYRLGIPEFAGGRTPPPSRISPRYRRIYAVVIFLACFLLFSLHIIVLVIWSILAGYPLDPGQRKFIYVALLAPATFSPVIVMDYMLSPERRVDDSIVGMPSILANSTSYLMYIIIYGNFFPMLVSYMFLLVLAAFSEFVEKAVDGVWLGFLARRSLGGREIRIDEILGFSGRKKLLFEELYELVTYIAGLSNYGIKIDMAGTLIIETPTGEKQTMDISDIKKAKYSPMHFDICNMSIYFDPSHLLSIDRRKVLEVRRMRRISMLIALFCGFSSIIILYYAFFVIKAMGYNTWLGIMEMSLWMLVGALIFWTAYVHIPGKLEFARNIIMETGWNGE